MQRGRRGLSVVGTVAAAAIFCSGCFLPTGTPPAARDGGSYGYSGPTLELTVNGVHFGPAAPDPGAAADLVTTRDATTGRVTGASFRMTATLGTAGCALAFDRFGDGATLGVGQYTVQSMQGTSTSNGTVYPTTAQRIATPEGGAGCTGSGCDGAGFVLNAIDATHATGYFRGTVQADSGAGEASVVCSFWVTTGTYQP
jgi:hypothetical protein